MSTEEMKKEKQSNKKMRLLVCIGLPVLLLLGLYVVMTIAYWNKLWKNTMINGRLVGGLTVEEAYAHINHDYDNYQCKVVGRNQKNPDLIGELFVVEGNDFQYQILIDRDELNQIFENQSPFLWFIGLLKGDHYSLDTHVSYDQAALEDILAREEIFDAYKSVYYQNASLGDYDYDAGKFQILSETKGSELKPTAKNVIRDAVLAGELEVNLESLDLYVEAKITSTDAKLLEKLAKMNQAIETVITYDWHGYEVVVDKSLISQWIRLEADEIVYDEEAVRAFIDATSKEYDTFGGNRTFVTALGTTLSLPSKYGWKVNRAEEAEALLELLQTKESCSREPVYTEMAYCKGEDDFGTSYVEIDLTNQHLYLYIKGELILESDFVSGNVSQGNYTPGGVFGLTYKKKDAVLRGADYTTPVSYWMPFNGNIGMHDANWRRKFGGELYLTSGSHGCINLPPSKAAEIFEYMEKDFPIVCYYYEPIEDIIARLNGNVGDIPDESTPAPEQVPEEGTVTE